MTTQTTTAELDASNWAAEEFGRAELGDRRRTNRLLEMAKQAAQRPSGRLTSAFDVSADREGAYRWVQNESVDVPAVARSAHLACARKCRNETAVFVPVDASNLTIVDKKKDKGFGPVGTQRQRHTRGLHVMSAIAVTGFGVPAGMCGQSWWTRPEEPTDDRQRKRPLEEKETVHWLRVIEQTKSAFEQAGGNCVPWFQLDAGGDFRELLSWAQTARQMVTVRARFNRRLLEPVWGRLWPTLADMESLGEYEFAMPRGRRRAMRSVRVALRASRVVFTIREYHRRVFSTAILTAVYARELDEPPAGEKPIEWMLITNVPADSFEGARLVVYGYSLRWRIEAFHRTWKTTCRVEDTQLRSPHAVMAWATILASVAMRIERLTHLARENPDVPATEEFTEYEIQATILLRRPEGYGLGDVPTVGEMVRWIADQGGYVGHKSSGPPGAQTIGRGLREIEVAAKALANTKTLGKS